MATDDINRILDGMDNIRDDLNSFKLDLTKRLADLENDNKENTSFRNNFVNAIGGVVLLVLCALGVAVLKVTGIMKLP